MNKDPKIIVEEIVSLVNELAGLAGTRMRDSKKTSSISAKKNGSEELSGATGGIRMLIEEGKLDEPRSLTQVGEFLRQAGRHYSNPSVSMGLLNLVRERVLTRLPGKDKKWKYVIRK
ncbi:MAG: hypothetical protein ABSB78_05580 [Bacteroidota bacterium]